MFTGIIEEIGQIESIKKGPKSASLKIKAKKVLEQTKLGDSIATDGVCLTVTHMNQTSFTVDVMNETLNRSTIKQLNIGSRVNLERALTLSDRLGGHLVSGHIDGTGTIISLTKQDIATLVRINTEKSLLKYIIEKGSIAIDGISLTVVTVDEQGFTVSIIPYTKEDTTLLEKQIGSLVNIECDLIGKYVEKLLKHSNDEGITLDLLKKYGF
jgi:riboflavin synthase